MPIIKCKMCGGDIQLAEDKTFGTCEYCGSTMTLPKVSDDQRAAAFNRGNHFRRIGEFDKALSVYEHIVADDDNDAEAHWCCALCRFGIEYVEDPATYEWLPTCHRASFDSFLEDVDYLAALEHSDGITRRQYQKDAAKIAEVQRGILAASQNTEPYDVFISYKELDESGGRTRDSILAQEIYYRLKEKGWRVFFSRISLEDVPGTQYEPYIFAALNSAKVMIVVGTSAENLNAVWVKNEWSRFLSMMRKDRSKLLIPCYRDMDPYDLPEQLSVLMSYDMGKIGFIQDLIRGVDKVLSAEKKEHETVKETVKETVVVQGGEAAAKTAAAVKRGNLALEDGEWDKAKEYFEQALTLDAENAEAYLGLALADEKCKDEHKYISRACAKKGEVETLTIPLALSRINKTIETNVVEGFLSRDTIRNLFDYDLQYPSRVKPQTRIADREKSEFENNKNFNRAFRFAKSETAEKMNAFKTQLYTGLDRNVAAAKEWEEAARAAKTEAYAKHLDAAERKADELRREAEAKREDAYCSACKAQGTADSVEDYRKAVDRFNMFADYKDSAERIEECEAAVRDMEEQERQHREAEIRAAKEKAEAWRKSKEDKARAAAEEQARKDKAKKKKLGILAGVVAAAVLAVSLIVTKVIIPKQKYNAAVAKYGQEYVDTFYALNVGDVYKFGSYEQDNNTANGKEDIEWLVLAKEGARILVISKYALNCQQYNTSLSSVTWETCSLRKWLNGTFLGAAFSEEERAMIPSVTVSADNNSSYNTSPGNSTTDQVFLLSIPEANKYFSSNKARKCAPTAYAIAQGAWTSDSNKVHGKATCVWWLRSPGDDSICAAVVLDFGSVYDSGDLAYHDINAVRPALWIDLGS